jgi:hypothetical protein
LYKGKKKAVQRFFIFAQIAQNASKQGQLGAKG